MNLSYEKCISLSNCNYKLNDNVLRIIKTIAGELKEKEFQLVNTTKSSATKRTWKSAGSGYNKTSLNTPKVKPTWRSKNQEKTSSLYKQINLILNSVVETNAISISNRIQQLLLSHKEEPNLDDLYVKMSTQLIVNAFAQSLYSEAYATIISILTTNIKNSDFRKLIIENCKHNLNQVITGKNTSSHELKGCGSFYAHLCRIQFLSDSDYETFLVDMTKTLTNPELAVQVRDICCNILILSLQTIKNGTTLPLFIIDFIKQNIEKLWTSKELPMRMRIKLLDVKDLL